ncbi:hypothetical protein [Brevundimonas viscosa]|uniref:Lipoprotein n=1 Tax=Brevundimonas viscosa TaxID=871741 RepID=A0A1I6P3N9_9CAUL|nr:hypothetical protein [Brevundimonas viscosa]SFS34812.1 hypothetical protein SAMN05192570_0808 [Brevundimonas viscosa]
MRILSLAAALGLAACAGSPPVTGQPAGPEVVEHPPLTESLGDDCAVIAAVARDHYRFNTTDNLPPPLWLDDEGSGWAPHCDWSRHGLSFPTTHDPDRPHRPGDRIQWVSFKQPRYDSRGALVETGILHGPLAGMGYECRVYSGFNGWTAGECRNTWVS